MPNKPPTILCLLIYLLCISIANAAGEIAATSFEKDVRPILKAHCFHCHGEAGKAEGKVDLRLRRFLAKSTDSGPIMVPGQPAASLMLKLVKNGEMPKAEKKLSDSEIGILENWIAGGAKTLRDEPETVPDFYITEEERQHWAFQPVKVPEVPKATSERVRTPVDAFVLDKLQATGLSFAPDADRRTILRRLSLDLIGLPPSPEELVAFEADASADAYEKQVDRLLASPHYGERWARHWLDVAGYADSNGYTEIDSPRPHAWHFRDYVVSAFNADKPWNTFIREQLAGDELAAAPHEKVGEVIQQGSNRELLTATGFLRMVPDGTADNPADAKLAKNQVIAETVKVVSSSLLGLTVGCAQCHDHRYDPISHQDYHKLRAILEPAFAWKNWRGPAQRAYSLYTAAERAKAAEIEAQAGKMDEDRQLRARQRLDQIFEERLKAFPAEKQEWIRVGRNTDAAKRTADHQSFFKENPGVNVGTHEGLLNVFDTAAEKINLDERRKTNEFRNTRPTEHFIMAVTEPTGPPAETVLFHRGDHDQPRHSVKPGELEVLAGLAPAISDKAPNLATSGRRLAYAEWLTSGEHPLVARVLVNRFWLHHFGRGIVGTPGDFGKLGELPTHPELLDWLAADFVQGGWKLKRLHKLIVSSTVYRQNTSNPAAAEVDAENRLLGRFRLRRLDAESLRDSLLAMNGTLNRAVGGPPTGAARHPNGKIVTGAEELNANGEPVAVKSLAEAELRRSLYMEQRRSRPLTVLETFDLPVMNPNCETRSATTVTQQSLLLLNDDFTLHHADRLAQRLEKQHPSDYLARVSLAWELIYARKPTTLETSRALVFLTDSNHDWSAWCQTLLASNRFLYVE